MADSLPRVTLTAENSKSLQATVVHVYDREEWEPTDAPTLRNLAGAVFSAVPFAARVAVISTNGGQLLFIFEAAHRWFDVKGKPVRVSRDQPEA